MYKFDPTLYFITDSTGLSEADFLYKVECALDGGATMIQLREKDRTTREYIRLANRVHVIAHEFHVPLIIDDRVDVALATGAEGVHVGQTDMPVAIARRLMGPDRIVGATTKTASQAAEAYEQGADYLGVGAAFATGSKTDVNVISHGIYSEICSNVEIPVVAIGGIDADNIAELKGSGISGAAVISAVFAADDIEAAARKLKVRIAEAIS